MMKVDTAYKIRSGCHSGLSHYFWLLRGQLPIFQNKDNIVVTAADEAGNAIATEPN